MIGESKLKKYGWELESVNIVQSPNSPIRHRSECDPMIELAGRKVFPVIVSPMGAVTDENNYKVWLDNGFIPVVPRTVNLEKRIKISEETFASFSLSETENDVLKLSKKNENDVPYKRYICIDIAHGTMEALYDVCKKLRKKFGENIVIMTGNVANPEAYIFYEDAGIDYMRIGIGTGSRCVVAGTKIKMANGEELPIEKIDKGDEVQTMNGAQKVLNTFSKRVKKTILINGEIEATPNHKFFVIKKEDFKENLSDNEIKNLGFYLEAEKLNENYMLVEG
jgi:hypothetical protein